jgi:predicted dehydrogenase
VANVTASRVSTERVRKMRFFQAHEYISLDFTRQDALRIRVQDGMPQFEKLPATPGEPLQAELEAFAECVRTRKNPLVDGPAGRRALELADQVMAGILDHGKRVQAATFANPAIP